MNQKARTRSALLQAAMELVREGRPPSIPDAAERALISVATAYRYFTSAEDLWWEAAEIGAFLPLEQTSAAIRAAGDDVQARLETYVRVLGFHMLEDQMPYRRLAKAALEQWFDQSRKPEAERATVRERRRVKLIALILEPLRGRLPNKTIDRVANALGVVTGTDIMLALADGMALDVPEAKKSMLDASRWILAGALAEIGPSAEAGSIPRRTGA